jgi:hypothetical protein
MKTGFFFDVLDELGDRMAEKRYRLPSNVTGSHNPHTNKLILNISLELSDVSFRTNVNPSQISTKQAFFEAPDLNSMINKMTNTVCFFADKVGSADFFVGFEVADGKVGGPGATTLAAAFDKKKNNNNRKPVPKKKAGGPKKKK